MGCKKKILSDGIGYESPKDLADIQVSVSGSVDGDQFMNIENATFRAVNGDDLVPWGVEKAILGMKRNEKALVTMNTSKLFDSHGKLMFTDNIKTDGLAQFTVHCQNFSKVNEPFEFENVTDKVDAALERKEVGNKFYLRNNNPLADRFETLLIMQSTQQPSSFSCPVGCTQQRTKS